MSFLRGNGPGSDDRKGPSMNRIIIWVIVGAVGLYLVGSGVVGLLTP